MALADCVIGFVELDGKYVCISLEDAWRDNKTNISCIPPGVYRCEWGHMNTLNVDHYHVLEVPGRSGIFIHVGSHQDHVQGCILLGTAYGRNLLHGSSTTVKHVEDLLKREPFILDIR